MLTSFALSTLALALLALSMHRHYEQVAGRPLTARHQRPAAIGGWTLLTMAGLAAIFQAGDMAMGLTWWFGMVAVAATLLALLFTYRPRLLPALVLAMLALALAGWATVP